MTDIRCLEYPTLKVPYEILNKKFRTTQRHIDREISFVQQAVLDVEKSLAQSTNVQAKGVNRLLGNMVDKLQTLKRKANESISDELKQTMVCKRRIDHLKEHEVVTCSGTVSQGSKSFWARTRLDRMIIEYFLRNGYYDTAIKLAKSLDIEDLTNIDIFLVSREVEKSLMNRQTSKCLSWCHDNRSKLRKVKSDLEFKLRLQEFIEMIRCDKMMEAIKHSRKYFPSFEEEHLSSIQQGMALLAFSANTEIECYRVLFDPRRWDMLIEQFRNENYRLYHLSNQSVFTATLQAGLSSMKTPQCYSENEESKNLQCPVCQSEFKTLAEELPFQHCSQSR